MLRFAICISIVAALATTVGAQTLLGPYDIYISNRIVGPINTTLWQNTHDRVQNETSNGWMAMSCAATATRSEAHERLALALEAFRWKDPVFFEHVMQSYNLRLIERNPETGPDYLNVC